MNATIADPLFIRAEVQYRQETWGVGRHHHAPADRQGRWQRWATAHRLVHRPARAGTPSPRPRHP